MPPRVHRRDSWGSVATAVQVLAQRGGNARVLRGIDVLEGIARAQAAHMPLTAAQLAFVDDAVVVELRSQGCTTVQAPNGWYVRLLFHSDPLEFDPTIADVHTQPTDELGSPVGRVLHVGTAWPRAMVVSFEGCDGKPRAYVGLASSYYERVTSGFQRSSDSDWAEAIRKSLPPEPRWMECLVSR